MQFVGFQFYWPSWWHLWPHYSRTTDSYQMGGLTTWYDNVFCFGPLQFRWRSGFRSHVVWWEVFEYPDDPLPFYVRLVDRSGWFLDYGRFETRKDAVFYRDHILPEASVALLEENKVFESLYI